MKPVVSVCIANFNGVGLIDECIESVRTQDFSLPVEIIVHDDASTDGSANHIRDQHSDVKLIASEENVGFCVANNRMAAVARGEYLLLLNNDAVLMPDALRTLNEEATRTVHPAILSLPQYEFISGGLIDRGCFLDPFFNPVPNLDQNVQDVAMVIGACLWVPKTLWFKLDGFPGWFESIGEDLYLCCRARLIGQKVRVLNQSGYRHRVGQSFGGGKVTDAYRLSTTVERRCLTERNKTFALVVTCPAPVLMLVLPLHLALLYLEGLILTALKRQPLFWKTVYAPILPSLWRKRLTLADSRRWTQKHRKMTTFEFLAQIRWLPRKLEMLFRHGIPEIHAKEQKT